MERLTFKTKENDPYIHGKAYVTCNVKDCLSITCEAEPPCERMQEVVDRLYDFEDILGEDYDLDRMRELVEADRDGRCVFTKCKLGDTGGFFKKLLQSMDELKRELEIAVQDLETIMLQGGKNTDTCEYCKNDKCYVRGGRDCCTPIWRGRDNPSVTAKPCLIPYTGEH